MGMYTVGNKKATSDKGWRWRSPEGDQEADPEGGGAILWTGVTGYFGTGDESEPFRFILALAAGYFGTIPINPDPSGRIFRNHQDISEPTIRSSALMNF